MTSSADNRVSEKPFAVVLGATGLGGRYLVKRLADNGFEGLCLSRRAEPAPYEIPPGFSWGVMRAGEALDIPASAALFSLAPISALPALIPRITGGNRLIALSTSSVLFKVESSDPDERELAQALARAEEKVQSLCQDRGLAWTIFRPTLIYDPGRDRNVSAIAAFVQRFGVFPLVWPGSGSRQPIHADDVALALVAAANAPRARDALFDLPGETLTYREMVRRIFEALGRRPVLLYLPPSLARGAFYAWRAITGEKYSSASLDRMNMTLTLDPTPVREALGVTCRPFRPEFPEPANPRRVSRAP